MAHENQRSPYDQKNEEFQYPKRVWGVKFLTQLFVTSFEKDLKGYVVGARAFGALVSHGR